jgi:putative spermidine/putrescine transport system substrate-binding protein
MRLTQTTPHTSARLMHLHAAALGLIAAVALAACSPSTDAARLSDAALLADTTAWSTVEAEAEGRTVTVAMWQGDPYINRYMREYVAPSLEERHGIEMRFVALQGNQIVSAIMTEQEADAEASAYDMVWINGETFYQLRQIDALWGPFVGRLPSARYVDTSSVFIRYDFQQPTEGYEAPWGNVQMALIYDSVRVAAPPRTPEDLEAWVRANPGQFTFDSEFTGMTFLKALLIHFADGPTALNGPFDEAKYEAARGRLVAYLKDIQPHLWREGRTFPQSVAQLHQLYAGGEVAFTMSNNDGEVDNKVAQGLLPETSRAYVLETGTIQNSHYWGIPARADDKAAALVAIDFLLSPEAQFEKAKPEVWGDGTVLATERLPAPWPERFADIPGRRYAPPRAEIQPYALQEPAAEYMIRLYDDVRAELL